MFNALPYNLTENERTIALRYWNSLLFPGSSHAYYVARDGLKEQNTHVFHAIMNALVLAWGQDNPPKPEDNPFLSRTYQV
ncbi:MAG: hypothetical protein EOP06_14810 [Proteobacteria bacterium]|nr:MAG: hypothetical protein EOP06_14810 [Pseudomonadota bacterium]